MPKVTLFKIIKKIRFIFLKKTPSIEIPFLDWNKGLLFYLQPHMESISLFVLNYL